MDQEERGRILSAAVKGLSDDDALEPEPPTETSEEPEGDVEAAAEEVEVEASPEPSEPKIPKRRLDEEIRKKREAEEQAAYWKGRAESVAVAQQPQATEAEADEDEDILSRLDRRLLQMEQRQRKSDQVRAVEDETARLKAEIGSAVKSAPLASAQYVAREMLLDPRMSAADAAQIVHDRETQREAQILKKHSIAKQRKGDAARRPKTTGSPAIAAEEKQTQTRDSAKRAFADAFNRFKDEGR